MEPYMVVAYAIFASMAYSGVFYLRKKISTGEEFSPPKALATCSIGLLVGLAMLVTNQQISEETIEVQLTLYSTLIIIAESAWKFVFGLVFKNKETVQNLLKPLF